MKTETRNVENFNRIKFKDFGKLILIQGEEESLTIEADEELLPELISEVRGTTLHLGIAEDWLNRIGKVVSSIFNNKTHKVTYTLTFKDLEKIGVSGQCNLECESLETSQLELNISGMGDMTFKHLDCDSLDMHISGRGEFSAAGRADYQEVRISGSGEYETPHLAGKTAKVVISGQGNATLRVEESLEITISGLGQVNYYGRPKLRQVISGMGKSKRLNEE